MSIRRSLDTILKKLEKEFITHNLIEVSGSAIVHNVTMFKDLHKKQVIPVLKGNAYGHGIDLVATALKSLSLPYIAVDGYFEALRIREVSEQPVLVMGAILPENSAHLNYDNFSFVVQDEVTIHALGRTGRHIKVHLECNTGMNRYGAKSDEVRALTTAILGYKNLEFEGVMSHLADSDGEDPATVDMAVAQFDECVEMVCATGAKPTMLHVAQTAGSLKARSKYANMMRLGVGLYGINPFPADHDMHRKLNGLKPALKFTSTITKIIDLDPGDMVSYNYTFTAPKKMRVGVLPVGYYEGINRALSNVGCVKIGSSYAPIVGRVCMNHTMINLDAIDAHVGDVVVVYSDEPTDKNAIDTTAREHGLFNYTLLTSLNSDVRRRLVS